MCKLGPDYDFVKLLDFGLVKDLGDEAEDLALTSENFAPGTPAFMAPEMATGKTEIGPYTDIYALGCVAYWLLTGELVFTGKTAVSVITQHITEPPVPVSQRTEFEIPQALEELIMDCLRKDPAERPGDAEEFHRRLERVELDQPWTHARAKRWWLTHRPTEKED